MSPSSLRVAALLGVGVVYFAVLNARPDFTRFNADDSESYLALADSLASGRGYTRSLTPGDSVPHTTWPPGLPVILMPAMALGGDRVNWHLVKGTMALVGLAGVVIAWVYVRRWTGRPAWADLAALLLATNAGYWDFSHQAMCEVPLVVHMLAALLLVDRVWAGRSVRPAPAILAGVFAGLGMMIKGHALGLGLLPLAYLVGPRACLDSRRRQLLMWVVYGVGMVVPFGAWTARNSQVKATGFDGINQVEILRWRDPNDGSKGVMTPEESAAAIKRNVTERAVYRVPAFTVPGLWHPATFDWPRSGYLALPVAAALVVFSLARLRQTLAVHLVIWPMTALNLIIPFGGALRYWVPFGCLLTVALVITVASVWPTGLTRRWYAVAVLLLGGNLATYIVWHERHPYSPYAPYADLAELFRKVADTPLETRGVRTQNPHAFQLMTGHRATGNQLDPDYAVVRTDGGGAGGGTPVATAGPWALVKIGE